MTSEEAKAFEVWLLSCYQQNNNVPFHLLAQVLKEIRLNAGR